MIYLDNNATSLIDPRVAARVAETMNDRLANPSSQHAAGRLARRVIEDARESILKHVGARTVGMASDQLLFTSGGTEANNLAVFGIGLSKNTRTSVVVSSIEHPSVLSAAQYMATQGHVVRYLPCKSDGQLDLDCLEGWLEESEVPIRCVSLMLANNETGVLQDVARASKMCRVAGAMLHTDAVQVLGKMPMSFSQLDVDAMTVTAHKLHGPLGIGALILRHGIQVEPQLFGGFQQMGIRPGTETPALASGFALAVELAVSQVEERARNMLALLKQLEANLTSAIGQSIVIGRDSPRLPHTLSISFPGLDRQALQLALDHAGVACSTGSACASGSSQPSHVLQAMGLSASVVNGAVRFSLSHETTETEISEATPKIIEVVQRMQSKSISIGISRPRT